MRRSSRSGVRSPGRADHYLTRREAKAIKGAKSPRSIPRTHFGKASRHARYAESPAQQPPQFKIPDGYQMSEPTTIQLIRVETRLCRGRELAAEMKVNASFILAMKRAGYRFTHGHQTTLESALAWRAAFPDFRVRPYLCKTWRKLPKLIIRPAAQKA